MLSRCDQTDPTRSHYVANLKHSLANNLNPLERHKEAEQLINGLIKEVEDPEAHQNISNSLYIFILREKAECYKRIIRVPSLAPDSSVGVEVAEVAVSFSRKAYRLTLEKLSIQHHTTWTSARALQACSAEVAL